MNTKEKTLEDVSPEAFGLIMALNEKAYAKLAEPDFVRVLPPPEDHAPGALIYSWGVEMLRLGFELAAEIFLSDELAKEADNDRNDDCRDDINRQG